MHAPVSYACHAYMLRGRQVALQQALEGLSIVVRGLAK